MSTKKIKVGHRSPELSNLDKMLYPQSGLTKAHVLDYYRSVSAWLLPHLRLRPLTLKRYPNGVEQGHFYEKRCPAHRPEWMPTARVPHSKGKVLDYCTVNDLPGLMWIANMASLELHVLLSRAPALTRPTAVAFDLDPGPPAGLIEASEIGLLLSRVLEDLGLKSFPKVSGGKGLHLYAPLNTPCDFEQTKDFARTVAGKIEAHYPERVVSKMKKDLRGGKVFIDWSQNDEHKTTVCAYSLRAGEPPYVSAPVTWDEVEAAVEAGDEQMLRFSPGDVRKRLEERGDLFVEVLTLRQRLPGVKPQKIESVDVWDNTLQEGSGPAELGEYRKKRDFAKTPEPAGGDPQSVRGTFVIQKHAASHLHYDLRLEAGGVLKSWAVPKGVDMDPDEKRLAMQVEDHPVNYARFEGRIPKGEYGGGEVIVWDFGPYEPKGAPDSPAERDMAVLKALEDGKLEFTLFGVKLQGTFILVRSGKQEDGKVPWLLMKKNDTAARKSPDPREIEPWSVISGLWIEDLTE